MLLLPNINNSRFIPSHPLLSFPPFFNYYWIIFEIIHWFQTVIVTVLTFYKNHQLLLCLKYVLWVEGCFLCRHEWRPLDIRKYVPNFTSSRNVVSYLFLQKFSPPEFKGVSSGSRWEMKDIHWNVFSKLVKFGVIWQSRCPRFWWRRTEWWYLAPGVVPL